MQDMLNQAESQAAGFQKEVKKEKKLREKAERLSSDFHIHPDRDPKEG
jgi:hypothetical protein